MQEREYTIKKSKYYLCHGCVDFDRWGDCNWIEDDPECLENGIYRECKHDQVIFEDDPEYGEYA